MNPLSHKHMFGLIALLGSLAALPAAATTPGAALPTKMRVRINTNSALKDMQLLASGIDLFAPTSDGYIEAFVTPEERDYLEENLGYELVVLTDDIYQEFENRHGFLGNGNLRDYRNYAENASYLAAVEAAHPEIAHRFEVGTSLEGRTIWGLKISDNVMTDEDEPEVLYTAIHHAREPVSNETVLQLIGHFADDYGSDPEVTALVDNRELFFVPIVNPDGYVYVDTTNPYWRKNRRGGYGVDINRNYGFKWGYDNIGSSPYTSDETYRGSAAFSEPETQAIRDLCEAHEFVFAVNFHTYGEYYLWPWGYIPSPTPEQELYATFGDSLSQDNHYTAGISSIVLYGTNGDADDWMYGEQETKPRIFAITCEIGDDFWPATYKIQGFVDENIEPAMYLARQAGNPFEVLPPRASVLSAPAVSGADYTVVWDDRNGEGYDPPVSYRLDEMSGLHRATDNLESGSQGWSAAGGFSLRTNRYHSSSHSFYSGQQNQNVATLTAQTDLAVGAGDAVEIWTWYNIEDDWDYAYVQVSADGGASWTNLAGNITTNSNPHGNNQGNGITGSSGGWIQGTFSLADFVGSTVMLRFSYNTDQAVLEEGFYVDDISPVEYFDSVQTLVTATPDRSFEISGHATGEYYYRVRGVDADNQVAPWSARQMVQVTDTDLEIRLVPDSETVPLGGTLSYTGTITNHGAGSRSVQVWADATLPSGVSFPGNPVVGPQSVEVAAGATLTLPVTHLIPGNAPLGTYTYTANAGTYPNAEEAAVFTFAVTPTATSPASHGAGK